MSVSTGDALFVKPTPDQATARAQRAYQDMIGRATGRLPFEVTHFIVHRPRPRPGPDVPVLLRLRP